MDAAREVTFIQDGRSQRYVARILGVSQSCIRKTWDRFLETGP